MLILTPNNTAFEMNAVNSFIPDEQYCALDLSDISDTDYFFHNILSTMSFSALVAVLTVGEYTIQMPLNWQILLGDENTGMMEVSSIEDLISLKDPHAFVYNPYVSRYPHFMPVCVKNICTINLRWVTPCLSKHNMLAVPLTYTKEPLCCFFADEIDKFPDFNLGI